MRRRSLHRRFLTCAAIGILAGNSILPGMAASAPDNDNNTVSPIKHVIVIIGENRSFDHVFATYQSPTKGQTVLNLLSEGIVKADGTPGANYAKALQYSASDYEVYQLSPQKTPYATLPPVLVGGPKTPYVCSGLGLPTNSGDPTSCNSATNLAALEGYSAANGAQPSGLLENGLETADQYRLLTGGTGQTSGTPDARITYDGLTATTLPPGPYQLTTYNSTTHSTNYDFYAASPVHRFMQMQQQLDCDASQAKKGESFGCSSDLYPWVEVTVGAGSNGAAPSASYTETVSGEGAAAMGFYNMQQGDAPYFKSLADKYAMSDNFHQSVKGGTGANHIMLGTADAIYFSDGNGNATTPPNNPVNPANPGQPITGFSSALSEVENPNPQDGYNNWYTQDGYGGGSGAPGAARRMRITAAAPTSTARTKASRASARSSNICRTCPTRWRRIAPKTIIIWSTTTIPAISATARTPTPTPTPTTTSTPSRRPASKRSATC